MPRKSAKTTNAAGLDAFDRAILRLIQKDNKTPHRKIAEAVHLSAAAVQRRIVAMEESGVIIGNVALVEPYAVQAGITAITQVQLCDERAATVDKAKALFKRTPEVQQCYYVTGGISFVLVIVAPDMRVYEGITRRLFAENALVKSFSTLVALDRVKADSSIVVP